MDRIQETSFSTIRVAFNNSYIRIFGFSNRSSASDMYENYNICNFENVLRNNIDNFIRLESCTHYIIQFLIQSGYMKFEVLKRWVQIL